MIDWIVTSSALILLVAILRVIIKGRVSPRLRYALWGLVLVRLLIPGTLWKSQASVMAPVAARQEYQAIENIPSYIKTQPDGWIEIGTHGGQNWTSIPPERLQPGSPVHYDWPPVEAELETLQKQVSVRDALLWTWRAGIAAVGIFLLAVNLRFDRRLKGKRRTLEQYRGRRVFTMDGLPTPCLFGLFRPAIYLTPEVAEDETAKAHVLAHEYAHFRQGDHIWAVLRGVCLAVHWYNPLVWLAAYLSRRDCELSCDEGAVRLLGEASRADYGRTLVGLVARRTTPRDLVCCATTMTGGKSALKERIALLVKRPRTTVWMACIVAAACVVFAACTFTGAAEEENGVPDMDVEPSQTVPDETAEPDEPLSVEPMRQEDYARIACQVMEEELRSEGVQDCRINDLAVWEWRVDVNSGDCQAVFNAEVMVLAEDQERWMTGNTVAAQELEDPFYRDYDGWLVFWWTGYLVYDSQTSQWSIPVTATSGCLLDTIDEDLGLETAGRDYRRFHALPEDLPTELMDPSLPDGEQGEWLLLAQAPQSDIALYRRAWNDQRVYLRVTNMSFQVFDRDLSGMELLPVLDTVEGDADITVQILYRRYEGTYFNGTSYEPGIVADQAFYSWDAAAKYWTEWYFSTQPAQLTEDRPVLADLPARLVRPETADADMWLIGELPQAGISVYYERLGEQEWKTWLRYGDSIQPVEGITVCLPQLILPELHFEDLDGDGDRELIAISQDAFGSSISREVLSVYEWDGGNWSGQTFDADWLVNSFNNDLTYQFYDDGTAFIWNSFIEEDLLLDLSELWESGYWDDPPDVCGLHELLVNYAWQDGQLTLTLGGELLDSSGYYLHGHAFDYTCPVVYSTYNGIGSFDYFECWFGTLRSDYAVEPKLPALPDAWRTVLEKALAECSGNGTGAFAVYDVNGDGEDELIVRWMPEGGTSASWGTSVYDAGGKERFRGHGQLTFYSNGAISVPWTHNQGPACAIFPYDLYVCNPSAIGYGTNHFNSYGSAYFNYNYVGSARARNNVIPGFEAIAYADLDGDGMVYYIGEDAYTEENPVDNAVYEAWRDQYLAGAKILPVRYWSLTEENISR